MTTTPAMPELPEPELGYIETDKSKQPAFSARQMRVALQSAQPAEVSDAEIERVFQGCGGKWDGDMWVIEDADFHPAIRTILALRPQAESEQEKELRRSLAEAQATISQRNAEVIELHKRIHRSPQAVPMTDEPFLKVHKGEICYKSDADDQSYGMWCPVNWDTEHGFSDGTVFYAHHGITQRADAAHQPAKEPR